MCYNTRVARRKQGAKHSAPCHTALYLELSVTSFLLMQVALYAIVAIYSYIMQIHVLGLCNNGH